jgi:hypothetical protein
MLGAVPAEEVRGSGCAIGGSAHVHPGISLSLENRSASPLRTPLHFVT